MPQSFSWQWLLAMSLWNPLPKAESHMPQGGDSYCPKPVPMVSSCRTCQRDDYLAKPMVLVLPECRTMPTCHVPKTFPILGANNVTGCQRGDGCRSPDFFGLRPRP